MTVAAGRRSHDAGLTFGCSATAWDLEMRALRTAYKKRPGAIVVIAEKTLQSFYNGLQLAGEVMEVCSPIDARSFFRNHSAKMILLDCGQKVAKGLDLLKQLKNAMPDVPIIFLSDKKTYATAVKGFQSGARDVVGKPVTPFDLKATIQQILRVKKVSTEKRTPLDNSKNHGGHDSVEKATTATPASVACAIHYIEKNLANKLSLEQIAGEANLSKYHFSRLFQHHTGRSPLQFAIFLRIKRAKELLQTGQSSVSDICDEVGFSDIASFTRHFKKHVGMTPTVYMRSFLQVSQPKH